MALVWQETRDNPGVDINQIKGIKMGIYADKRTLTIKTGEVRWATMIHESDTSLYCGVVLLDIDDSRNLRGKIGCYDPEGKFSWLDSVKLNWNTWYKFCLVRSKAPTGDIYLNMYVMDSNETILAIGSLLVPVEANHPYIMTELQAPSKPYQSAFEYVFMYPIDIYMLDGTVYRWSYVDGVNINEYGEEATDHIISTSTVDLAGDMFMCAGFNE